MYNKEFIILLGFVETFKSWMEEDLLLVLTSGLHLNSTGMNRADHAISSLGSNYNFIKTSISSRTGYDNYQMEIDLFGEVLLITDTNVEI